VLRAVATALLLATAAAASADDSASGISWGGVRVASTEGLWRGRKHDAYPLTHLFDGDPATCWAFAGTTPDTSYGVPHALDIHLQVPRRADGVRIMNGHNGTDSLYRENHRVTRIAIWSGGEPVADASLPERTGWHVVPFPEHDVANLHVELAAIAKGPRGDLCLAGLELVHRGRSVDLGMPLLVIGTDGGEAVSDTSYLMTRQGRRLARDEAGFFGGGAAWDAAGRHVAAVERGESRDRIWIADARDGRIVAEREVPAPPPEVPYALSWEGRRLRAGPDPSEGDGPAVTLDLDAASGR
jgi:hypothetical protein